MSKLTTREYKNIAKRPSTRGHGRAVLRDVPKVAVRDLVDEAEQDLTELEMGSLEVEASIEDVARSEAPGDWVEPEGPGRKQFENPQTLGSIDKGNAL